MRVPSSYLFVPAIRIDRVDKALSGSSHAVIVDLEDGVSNDMKEQARERLETWSSNRRYLLRINPVGSEFCNGDLGRLSSLRNLEGVVLAKVEDVQQVEYVQPFIPSGLPLIALIESALGLIAAPQIARAGVNRLFFGSADYLANVGAAVGREVLNYPRSCLVVASAAAGLDAPIDGPSLELKDLDVVHLDAKNARALGMGGKLCIHPLQVETINSVFYPTPDEINWAESVVTAWEATTSAVFQLDGKLIDAPIIRQAQRIIGLL